MAGGYRHTPDGMAGLAATLASLRRQVDATRSAALTDGFAPASSPAPVLLPVPGGFTIQMAEVANADAVTVDVYVSAATPVAVDGVNRVGAVPNGGTLAVSGLVYATNYYVLTVARDADGSAPASEEVQGQVLAAIATDGLVPTASPTPVVVGGFGVLYATLPEVANADRVTVRVYASAVTPVTSVAGSLVGAVPNGGTLAIGKVDGAALVAGTRYYVATTAFDDDGDGPLSAESSDIVLDAQAGIFPIESTDIADNAISTPKLQANAVTAAKVAADVMITNSFYARDGVHVADGSGASLDLTSANGYQQTDATGASRVSFPTNPLFPNVIRGQATLDGLTVLDDMSIRGTNNEISRDSVFTMATGTTPPTTAVVVADYYPTVTNSAANPMPYGFIRDGSGWTGVTGAPFSPPVKLTSISDAGVVTSVTITGLDPNQLNLAHLTKIGSTYYVAGSNYAASAYVVIPVSASGVAGTPWTVPIEAGYYNGAYGMTTDGTSIILAHKETSSGVLRARRYGVTGTSPTTIFTSTELAGTSLTYGTFDFGGTVRYLVGTSSAVVSLNASGAVQSAEGFPRSTSSVGLGWDGTRFVSAGSDGIKQHSTNKTARTLKNAYEWYDSDPAGTGTHETGVGSIVTATQSARAGLRWTTPPPADAGAVDNPDSARLYVGLSDVTLKLQGSPFVTTIAILDPDPATGAAPPTVNTFPAGVAGRIESASGLSWFAGDDDAAFPVVEARSATDATTKANAAKNRATHTGSPTAAVAWGGQKITGLADGTAAQDAVTKTQLDNVGVSTRPVSSNLSGDTTTTTGTTYVPLTSGSGPVFVAPPSGSAIISMSMILKTSSGSIIALGSFEVRTGSTVGSGTVFRAASEMLWTSDTGFTRSGATELVTGLTPGTTYNVRAMFAIITAGNTATASRATIVVAPCL